MPNGESAKTGGLSRYRCTDLVLHYHLRLRACTSAMGLNVEGVAIRQARRQRCREMVTVGSTAEGGRQAADELLRHRSKGVRGCYVNLSQQVDQSPFSGTHTVCQTPG